MKLRALDLAQCQPALGRRLQHRAPELIETTRLVGRRQAFALLLDPLTFSLQQLVAADRHQGTQHGLRLQLSVSVNAHTIRANAKHGRNDPPIRIAKTRADKKHRYVREIKLVGNARVLYSPDAAILSCGAAWSSRLTMWRS
jgi:hypothetical protein